MVTWKSRSGHGGGSAMAKGAESPRGENRRGTPDRVGAAKELKGGTTIAKAEQHLPGVTGVRHTQKRQHWDKQ